MWRQVLDYFDGLLIGFTPTPTTQTMGFLNGNVGPGLLPREGGGGECEREILRVQDRDQDHRRRSHARARAKNMIRQLSNVRFQGEFAAS